MTPEEHYAKADEMLAEIAQYGGHATKIARAQVHATLATVNFSPTTAPFNVVVQSPEETKQALDDLFGKQVNNDKR